MHIFLNNLECVMDIGAGFNCKSEKTTEELGWYYNDIFGTSHRGLEISMISVTDLKSNIADTMDVQQTLDEDG
ncbi:hypothetical protein QT397_24320 [Microbulbifer sp. MKSA007]|nr:hypothetical protein QT397_24320 [Microbulbifer sp. MKSA007]